MTKTKQNQQVNTEEITKLKADITELENGWKRTQADLENYRRRSEQEKSNLIKSANKNLILEILPVIDNFSRALEHKPVELANNEYLKGLEYTKIQLEKILQENSLEKIDCEIGTEFDPEIHEAIASEKSEKYQPDQIIEVIEAGYKIDDELLRPVKVKVAK